MQWSFLFQNFLFSLIFSLKWSILCVFHYSFIFPRESITVNFYSSSLLLLIVGPFWVFLSPIGIIVFFFFGSSDYHSISLCFLLIEFLISCDILELQIESSPLDVILPLRKDFISSYPALLNQSDWIIINKIKMFPFIFSL